MYGFELHAFFVSLERILNVIRDGRFRVQLTLGEGMVFTKLLLHIGYWIWLAARL
jgi:hypothetical protein